MRSPANHMCREAITPAWRRRERVWAESFRHARIITDPKELLRLKAVAEKQKRYAESDREEI